VGSQRTSSLEHPRPAEVVGRRLVFRCSVPEFGLATLAIAARRSRAWPPVAAIPADPRIQKGKDAMTSTSPFQQYLSPTDLTMLDRVLKKVCVRNALSGGSADAERVAALLIQGFQNGANTEANLMTAFDGDGDFKLRVPVTRLSRLMGNALYGWERDDGTTASISPSKELIP
jgi:hypothetical protein